MKLKAYNGQQAPEESLSYTSSFYLSGVGGGALPTDTILCNLKYNGNEVTFNNGSCVLTATGGPTDGQGTSSTLEITIPYSSTGPNANATAGSYYATLVITVQPN